MTDQTPAPIARSQEVWKRGLFMLLFILAFGIGHAILNAMAIVQFLWLLIARQPNKFLADFGASLATWLAEVARFQTCVTDDKPFPFRPWP